MSSKEFYQPHLSDEHLDQLLWAANGTLDSPVSSSEQKDSASTIVQLVDKIHHLRTLVTTIQGTEKASLVEAINAYAVADAQFRQKTKQSASLAEALVATLSSLPILTYDNGYPTQALPKAMLLGILAQHGISVL
jgi:hypothetical protein